MLFPFMRQQFYELLAYSGDTRSKEPHCALKVAKHLLKEYIIITLMTDLGIIRFTNQSDIFLPCLFARHEKGMTKTRLQFAHTVL